MTSKKELIDITDILVWAKDKNFKFIYCNEKFAEAAGADSPHQLIGKTDFDLCWRNRAEFYRNTDYLALNNNLYVNQNELLRIHTLEDFDMLVSKSKLLNDRDECIGVIGANTNITGSSLIKKCFYFDPEKSIIYLGSKFGNQYLTKREIQIIRCLLSGYSAKKIGYFLKISHRTVEWYIKNLKLKLQCSSKNEIISILFSMGLNYLL